MSVSNCPLTQARLLIEGVRTMYRDISYRFVGGTRPAWQMFTSVLAAAAAKCADRVDRAIYAASVEAAASREAEWTQYATAVEARLTEAISTVEESCAAWLEEQRKFRELATPMCTLGQAVERQAGSLANVSRVLAGVGSALPRPPPRLSRSAPEEEATVATAEVTAREMSPEV